MRRSFVLLHRWFGLSIALFLFVAGLTGAIISWDHELDEWLNPQFFDAPGTGPALPPLELAARLEAQDPRLQVRFMPLHIEDGHSLPVFVDARLDPSTQAPYDLAYNQVALDPATGAIQGRRNWGQFVLDREHLLPFLYKLHFTLHLPDAFGLPLGTLFMGIVAIIWVFDTLLALSISFPSLASWRQSFAFRWQAGGHRLTFDLHRSGGVWLFALLLMLAITSVSMNLRDEVMRPVVSLFSTLTPTPQAVPPAMPTSPMTREQILERATDEAKRRGLDAPAGGLFLDLAQGRYGVGFYSAGNSHGDIGLGNPWLYFDAYTGEPLGATLPGTGNAGDIFLQTMFPLHSGRIAGLPGRILISLCGLAVAVLSVTGVLIWARKRRARRQQAEKLSRRLGGTQGAFSSPR